MAAELQSLRFFVDESALGIGKVLTMARRDVIHTGHALIPQVPLGALDPNWIPAVAARGLTVIARDRHIRTKPGELALLRAHGLRVFWIAGKRDLSTWDSLARLVRRWNDIERILATRGAGPWFFSVNDHKLTELAV
ncbi:MAG: hypothetical protein EPO22_04905 [Dehalococcoidia bacterium]|nr:MAG: hypothetical protein EPO22_04905 [Dehalococcoidia bacterium]